MIHIVLHEPVIPQNTGNIARTCACTGADLHLIEPLGFSLEEKYVRRAGLDYWGDVDIYTYRSYEDFIARHPGVRIIMATTKAKKIYTGINYHQDDYIMFGKETAGIPEEILVRHPETCVRIPMREDFRSLNLSNSVAIVLYEALRQLDFPGLALEGHLRNYEWA